MAKTRVKKGWTTDGLDIPPLNHWSCSYCGQSVSNKDQESKGGWFDYNNNGKLSFVHFDCYQLDRNS